MVLSTKEFLTWRPARESLRARERERERERDTERERERERVGTHMANYESKHWVCNRFVTETLGFRPALLRQGSFVGHSCAKH